MALWSCRMSTGYLKSRKRIRSKESRSQPQAAQDGAIRELTRSERLNSAKRLTDMAIAFAGW